MKKAQKAWKAQNGRLSASSKTLIRKSFLSLLPSTREDEHEAQCHKELIEVCDYTVCSAW